MYCSWCNDEEFNNVTKNLTPFWNKLRREPFSFFIKVTLCFDNLQNVENAGEIVCFAKVEFWDWRYHILWNYRRGQSGPGEPWPKEILNCPGRQFQNQKTKIISSHYQLDEITYIFSWNWSWRSKKIFTTKASLMPHLVWAEIRSWFRYCLEHK